MLVSPWVRLFVEGVIIVGSILLAFGIEAWWDERRDRGLLLHLYYRKKPLP